MLPLNARDIPRTKHHLSHHFEKCKGVPMLADAYRPGIGGEPLRPIDGPPFNHLSLYPPCVCPKIPPWLSNDTKVLSFDAYLKETMHEVYQAQVRILFYLEDGTMQVSGEPRVDNAGLSQGCVVSRTRVPRPPPCQHEFLSMLDLNVNQTVTIYDRVYHIAACDAFTRHHLNRTGISVPDDIDTPLDSGQQTRARLSMSAMPRKPSVHVNILGQILENDRRVLRFGARWDDRESMFGDIHDLILYYFLADDTIQLQEVNPRNSERDLVKFLDRQKIPKEWQGVLPMDQKTPFTGGRIAPDCLGVDGQNVECYTDKDLTVGYTVNIYGRQIHIVDCDDFTREHYRKKYGMEDLSAAPRPSDKTGEQPVALYDRVLPERETIRSAVHSELYRQLWDDMARLKEHLYHLDPIRTGFMSAEKLASALMAFRLPLSVALVQKMFAVLNKKDDGQIDVNDLLLFIDSGNHKTQPIQPEHFDIDVCPKMPFLQ